MTDTCLVGNTTDLPEKFKYLLSDSSIEVLANETSGINSCHHLNFDQFKRGDYRKCIVIYSHQFGRYVHFDFEQGHTITAESEFSQVSFLPPEISGTGFENPCYMFRMFLWLYGICLAKNIEVEVIHNDTLYTSDDFIAERIAFFGDPIFMEKHNGVSLYGYHNSHNEFLTHCTGKENLLIVLGDSWVVGDNQDVSKVWRPGQIKTSFSYLVAEHFDADLVVCGSPGNSNQGALLNFLVWYLFNKDFTNEYKRVKVLCSSTSMYRDFAVKGNIGNWIQNLRYDEFIFKQQDHKLLKDSMIAIETLIELLKTWDIPCHFIRSHSGAVHKKILLSVDSMIQPNIPDVYNYNQMFGGTEYFSSCGHPSVKGNEYLAHEVIQAIKEF